MNWTEVDNKLTKKFETKDFSELTAKLNVIAVIADEMDHHPDFKVWGYNKIEFSLSTHTSNSVTEMDYQLAEHINEVFG
jgi:4a-hydroxytetrahydrobiopterin dehydratase